MKVMVIFIGRILNNLLLVDPEDDVDIPGSLFLLDSNASVYSGVMLV